MTDQGPTAEELAEERLREEARAIVAQPAEPVEGAEGLPDDVRDGHIEDEGDEAFAASIRETNGADGAPVDTGGNQ